MARSLGYLVASPYSEFSWLRAQAIKCETHICTFTNTCSRLCDHVKQCAQPLLQRISDPKQNVKYEAVLEFRCANVIRLPARMFAKYTNGGSGTDEILPSLEPRAKPPVGHAMTPANPCK